MKLLKIALPICCALALAAALSACKQAPPSPEYDEEQYSVASKVQADLQIAVSDIEILREESGNVVPRRVTSEEGLKTALADSKNQLIRLEDEEAQGTVTVPEGDYADRDFIFDAPNADVTVNADVGTVTVRRTNENGCTVNGHAGTVFLCGEVTVTLKGGADRVYVSGKNARVVLESGDYPVIYCDNITDTISNKTKNDVVLILPNGSTRDIPAGKEYAMETGKLKSAR